MLIGKTSALTMNIAGVIKDWRVPAAAVLNPRARQVAPSGHGFGFMTKAAVPRAGC